MNTNGATKSIILRARPLHLSQKLSVAKLHKKHVVHPVLQKGMVWFLRQHVWVACVKDAATWNLFMVKYISDGCGSPDIDEMLIAYSFPDGVVTEKAANLSKRHWSLTPGVLPTRKVMDAQLQTT